MATTPCVQFFGVKDTVNVKGVYAPPFANVPFMFGVPVAFEVRNTDGTRMGTPALTPPDDTNERRFLKVTYTQLDGVFRYVVLAEDKFRNKNTGIADACKFVFELHTDNRYRLRSLYPNLATPYVTVRQVDDVGWVITVEGNSISDPNCAVFGWVKTQTPISIDGQLSFLLAQGPVLGAGGVLPATDDIDCNRFSGDAVKVCNDKAKGTYFSLTLERQPASANPRYAMLYGNIKVTPKTDSYPDVQNFSVNNAFQCYNTGQSITWCPGTPLLMHLAEFSNSDGDKYCAVTPTQVNGCGQNSIYNCATLTSSNACPLYDTPAGFIACKRTDLFAQRACAAVTNKFYTSDQCRKVAGVAISDNNTCAGYFLNFTPTGTEMSYADACKVYESEKKSMLDGAFSSTCNVNANKARGECACINLDGGFKGALCQRGPCTFKEYQTELTDRYGPVIVPTFFGAGANCWWLPCSSPVDPAYKPAGTVCTVPSLQTCLNAVTATQTNSNDTLTLAYNNCLQQKIYVNRDGQVQDTDTSGTQKYGCDFAGNASIVPWGKVDTKAAAKCYDCVNNVCQFLAGGDGTTGFTSLQDCANSGCVLKPTKYGCDAQGNPELVSQGTKEYIQQAKCCNCVNNTCVPLLNSDGNGTYRTCEDCKKTPCQPPSALSVAKPWIIGGAVALAVVIIIVVVVVLVKRHKKTTKK